MYPRSPSQISFLAVALPLFFFCQTGWPQSPNLPLDHWAYPFLQRLETKGLYVSQDFDTRPYSRQAIAEIIVQVHGNVQPDPTRLSNVEWSLFEQLKGEFVEELAGSEVAVAVQPEEYEPHLLTWKTEDIAVHFDGLVSQQFRLENKRKVDLAIPKSVTSLGFALRIKMKESLAAYLEGRTFILSEVDSLANTTFNPSLGTPITKRAFAGVTVTDNASPYFVVRFPWFDFEIGRDLVAWGPGFRGNLILSRNSNFYDLLKFTFRYKKFKFEHLHAFLNSDRTKYLAGHRLEIRPSDNLQFAINETVVYGDRNVEFLYLNPLAPIIVAERHLGDQDNNMISVDGSLFLFKKNLKFYTEILFDDFSFADNIFTDFVNKWGLLIGGYWVDPLALKNTDFRFEFLRIQPLVYSHRKSINTYSNYDNVMGHWLGPDADDWYFEIGHWMHRNLRMTASWEQRRRGNNDINDGERPSDGKLRFLDGVVERNRLYGLSCQWQVRRDLFFDFRYNLIQTENLRRQEGLNQTNHRLLTTLSLNY